MSALATLAVVVLIISSCYVLFRSRRVVYALPPALKTHPFIGHLLSLPAANQHIAYRDIGQQLNSDVISFDVLGQVIVVLNSIEAATDLLVKRSAIYSDRAELPMLTDERLAGWGKVPSFMHYGDMWKLQRKLMQSALQVSGNDEAMVMSTRQTRVMMQRLLKSPESIESELRWLTAANILHFVYGYYPSHPSDDILNMIQEAMSGLALVAIAGNFYVNVIPWLKYVPAWLPGAEWKRKANRWREARKRMFDEPYEWTLSQIAQGRATLSVQKTLLGKVENGQVAGETTEEQREVVRWVVGTIYSAGSDTTVSAELTLVLALVLHREIQQKVQEELDEVVGPDRLPELSDRNSLPYLNCVIKEALRWNNVSPLGIPHACIQDDTYKGYLIPKGAIVIGNIWAMSNNPTVYPEPSSFNPDRFLDPSVPDAPVFGFGRRICPGIQFAESHMFLFASTLLSIYNVVPSPGQPTPKAAFSVDTLISRPAPFSCTLAPRSERHRQLIESWVDS